MTYVTATETAGSVSLSSSVVREWQDMPFDFPERVLLEGDPESGVFFLTPTDENNPDTRAVTQTGAQAYVTCTALYEAIRELSGSEPPVRCPAIIENGGVGFDAKRGRHAERDEPVQPSDVFVTA